METIITGLSNKCLDLFAGNISEGTPIVLWDQLGNVNQMWHLTPEGYIESFMDTSKCIGIMGGTPNISTPVVLMRKNNEPYQKWDIDSETRLISRIDTNMCIDAGGALLRDGTVPNGFHLVIWNKNDVHDGQRWNFSNVMMPQAVINLSYKILIHPIVGILPRQDVVANINASVVQMNDWCTMHNTNFRFRLYEDPVLIGGPQASGHVNFWYNSTIMTNEHLKSFYNTAKLFFNPQFPFVPSNAFAWRLNAINIYLTGIGWGGRSAYPEDGELIALAVDADNLGFIHLHEIGHFFGLHHTFDDNRDDTIADTLLDDPNWNADDIAANNFNRQFPNYNSLPADLKILVDDAQLNLMSYHNYQTHPTLTPGQLTRWESNMRNQRRNVLLP